MVVKTCTFGAYFCLVYSLAVEGRLYAKPVFGNQRIAVLSSSLLGFWRALGIHELGRVEDLDDRTSGPFVTF